VGDTLKNKKYIQLHSNPNNHGILKNQGEEKEMQSDFLSHENALFKGSGSTQSSSINSVEQVGLNKSVEHKTDNLRGYY